MTKFHIAVLSLALGLCACAKTTIRQNPAFADSWSKKYSVAMLPPVAKVTEISFDAEDPRLKPEEDKAVQMMKNSTPAIFTSKGYEFKNIDSVTYAAAQPDVKFQTEKLREATKKELALMYKNSLSEDEAFKMKNSVGPLTNFFATQSGADLVLYMDYEGFEKSNAMIAKDVAASVLLGVLTGSVYVEPNEAGSLQVALIDGVTGNILWSNIASAPSTIPPLEAVFKELPNKTLPKPKKD